MSTPVINQLGHQISAIDLYDLYAKANYGRENALCSPGTNKVGAAILARHGQPGQHEYDTEDFIGASVVGVQCAEGGAISSAIAKGYRVFDLVVVASDTGAEEPCLKCRTFFQVLNTKPYIICIDKNGCITKRKPITL